MGKVSVCDFLSLNGYYKGPGEDISWYKPGSGENDYSAAILKQGNILLFGRVTYELMLSFWTGADAAKEPPEITYAINNSEKIVFSRTMLRAGWNNTRLVKDNMAGEIKKLKGEGRNMVIFGSGNIITQLADAGLIDNYQLMIAPVAIGGGTSLFQGIKQKLNLRLINTRVFKSGTVLLDYEPI